MRPKPDKDIKRNWRPIYACFINRDDKNPTNFNKLDSKYIETTCFEQVNFIPRTQ